MNKSQPTPPVIKLTPVIPGGRVGGKEMETTARVTPQPISEISTEIEVPHEVSQAGVVKIVDTIELPPDVKNLGVTQVGPAIPVISAVTVPPVILPLSDTQVVVGLSASVSLALRWLAVWCTKKLKKAHVALKVIHGKIIRVEQK